jgi:gamma-glutamylcysteine synthetase
VIFVKYDELEKCFNECQEKIEEIKKYVITKMNEYNELYQEECEKKGEERNTEAIQELKIRCECYNDVYVKITGKDKYKIFYKDELIIRGKSAPKELKLV